MYSFMSVDIININLVISPNVPPVLQKEAMLHPSPTIFIILLWIIYMVTYMPH